MSVKISVPSTSFDTPTSFAPSPQVNTENRIYFYYCFHLNLDIAAGAVKICGLLFSVQFGKKSCSVAVPTAHNLKIRRSARQRQRARNNHGPLIVWNVYVQCLCDGAEINKLHTAQKPSNACRWTRAFNTLFLGWRNPTKCIAEASQECKRKSYTLFTHSKFSKKLCSFGLGVIKLLGDTTRVCWNWEIYATSTEINFAALKMNDLFS